MRRTRLAAIILGVLTGCSLKPASSAFPIGIYGVSDLGQLKELRDAGFDSVWICSRDPLFTQAIHREAQTLGLGVAQCPESLGGRIDLTKSNADPLPSFFEIRFMSYLAIAHGARGLSFSTLQKPEGKTLLDFPEQWQALTRVVSEVKSLKPILEQGEELPLPFAATKDGLEGRALRCRGGTYILILNSGEQPLSLPMVFLDSAGWRPLFELRRDVRDLLPKEGRQWMLPPHRVLIFESH